MSETELQEFIVTKIQLRCHRKQASSKLKRPNPAEVVSVDVALND